MDFLISGITSITPQQIVMYVIGAILIWLAINKDLEPVLLLPLGFGAILVNLPASGVLNQTLEGIGETNGIIEWLFNVGIEASEAMPLLLFIGIGAMIDFGPLLSNPKLFLFGAAAQFGIFAAIVVACMLGFDLKDAASIGIIGAADGPTSILVSQVLGIQLYRAHCSGRLLLHGSCTDHPAYGHQASHNKKRTLHPYGVQTGYCFQKSKDHFPNRCYLYCRSCCPNVCFAGGIPYVWKPSQRMRRAE